MTFAHYELRLWSRTTEDIEALKLKFQEHQALQKLFDTLETTAWSLPAKPRGCPNVFYTTFETHGERIYEAVHIITQLLEQSTTVASAYFICDEEEFEIPHEFINQPFERTAFRLIYSPAFDVVHEAAQN